MSSSIDGPGAPRTVNVLPARVGRRVTRRDGLLPLVLAVELLAGIVLGLALHSGSGDATGVPAKLTLGAGAVVGVVPAAESVPLGPPSGVLLAQGPVVATPPAPYPTHAPRDPFAPQRR